MAPLRLPRTAPGEACATFPLDPGSYKTGERRLRRGLAERRVPRSILRAQDAAHGAELHRTGAQRKEETDSVTDRRLGGELARRVPI